MDRFASLNILQYCCFTVFFIK